MDLSFLTNLNLSPSQTKLYQLLLELGEVPAATLIKKSGLKRPTTYKILYELLNRGLVTLSDKQKITHFKPAPPEKLLSITHELQNKLSQTQSTLEALIPQLNASYLLTVEKPIITTFEGPEGLKKIYLDTLHENQPIYAALQVGEIHEDLQDWIRNTYAPKRSSMNIHAYVIVSTGDFTTEYIKQSPSKNRTVRVVPSYKFPFKHEINIYGEKIAIIQYKKGEQPIGIVIQHLLIAQTFKAIFDLAWEKAADYHAKLT